MTPISKLRCAALISFFGIWIPTPAFAQTCESDEDCSSHELCFSDQSWDCPEDLDTSCQDDESDQECIDRVIALQDEECIPTDSTRCVPRWGFPCSVATDCGVEGLVCQNSGCTPENETCETSADCPDLWDCAHSDERVSGVCGPSQSEVPVSDPDSGDPVEGVDTGAGGSSGGDSDDSSEEDAAHDEDPSGGCALHPAASRSFGPASLFLALGAGLIFARRRRYS